MNREQEMVSIACKAIDDKKALDIKVIDIREVSVIADYFVITSGSNLNQVQAIVDNVEEQLGRAGFEPKQIEGTRNSNWILMDYGDLIIHVFDEENRLFYDLMIDAAMIPSTVFQVIIVRHFIHCMSSSSNCS